MQARQTPKAPWHALESLSKSREANDLGEKRQEKNELLLSALWHRSVAIVLPAGAWWERAEQDLDGSTSAAPSRLQQHSTHERYRY
jgi:hypothetical protein